MDNIVVLGAGAMLVALLALASAVFALLFARSGDRRPGNPHLQTDLANMMILFQTMRDVISQQKEIAREFNRSLDRRVTEIRHMVDEAKAVRKQIEASRKELHALAQQVDVLERGGVATDTSHDPAPEAPLGERVEKPAEEQTERGGKPFQIIAPPEEETHEEDLIDSWAGVDVGYDAPEEPPRPGAPVEPEPAEETESAREAFSRLLNLSTSEPPADREHPPSPGGNGASTAPLHRRVYEYQDAGMTVPDIARELGIGKGEVRLILSLRKDREA